MSEIQEQLERLTIQIRDVDIAQRSDSDSHHRRLNELESDLKRVGDQRDFQVLQSRFDALKSEFDAYKREVVALIKSAVVDSKAVEIARAISDRLSQTVLTVRTAGQESSRAAQRPERQARFHTPEAK
jgi:hypothetical protein